MSITIFDDKARLWIEPGASGYKERIQTLKTLHENGIKTYAFIGPVLPFLTDLPKVFADLKGIVEHVMVESLNTREPYWSSLKAVFQEHFSDMVPKYEEIFFTGKKKEYLKELRKEVGSLGKKHNIKVKLFLEH